LEVDYCVKHPRIDLLQIVELLAVSLLVASCARAPLTDFHEDFQTGASKHWSKPVVSLTETGDRHYLGPFGFEEVVLSLENLAPHQWIRVEFDLYLFRSWNGNSTKHGLDVFTAMLDDGRVLHRTTFAQRQQKYFQSFPGFYPLHRMAERTGAAENNTLGTVYKEEESSAVYRLKRTFPHNKDTIKLIFNASLDDPIDNESWGLDNVSIRVHREPATPESSRDISKIIAELGSEDGAVANKAVDELILSGEGVVDELTALMNNSRRPLLADELLVPESIFFDYPINEARDEPLYPNDMERRQILAAFVLQLLGTAQADTALAAWENDDGLRHIPIQFIPAEEPSVPTLVATVVRNDQGGYWRSHSNTQGQVVVRAPLQDPRFMEIRVESATYADERVAWRSRDGKSFPDAMEIEVARPVSIGGRVVDDAGHPVSEATVYIHPYTMEDGKWKRTVPYNTKVATNSEGRWVFDRCHPQVGKVDLAVYHPRYVPTGDGFFDWDEYEDLEALLNEDASLTLERGQTVEVQVKGRDGTPLEGAEVYMGRSNVSSNALPWHQTDEFGSVVLAARAGSRVVITVKADGHAPQLHEFAMREGSHTAVFELEEALKGWRTGETRWFPVSGLVFTGIGKRLSTLRTVLVRRTIGYSSHHRSRQMRWDDSVWTGFRQEKSVWANGLPVTGAGKCAFIRTRWKLLQARWWRFKWGVMDDR